MLGAIKRSLTLPPRRLLSQSNTILRNKTDEVYSGTSIPKKIDRSKFPKLDEGELEEKFISGWGPGGQCVNKSINCCQLRHKPTGLIVKVHQTRRLDQNRKIARELLAIKLDNLYNGENSVENQRKTIDLHKAAIRERQAQHRRTLKESFKTMMEKEKSDNH